MNNLNILINENLSMWADKEVIALSMFIWGMLVASFIGVVVDRLPHQMEWVDKPKKNLKIWSPRSHCPRCKVKLGMIDLIPVIGWLVNKGKCKKCKIKIPATYPIVEFLTGVATASSLWIFGFYAETFYFILLLWSCLLLSWMDLTQRWLPAIITTPLLWIGLLMSPFEIDAEMRILGAMLGGMFIFVAIALTSYFKKVDAYSGGDIAMMMVAGAWIGAGALFDFIILTSFFVLIHSIPQRIQGDIFIPMGPSLCASLLAVIILQFHHVGILFPA